MNVSNHSIPWITVVIVIAIVAWTATSSAQPGQIADEPAVKQETEKQAKDKEPPELDVQTPIEALRKALPPTARPPSAPVRLRPPKKAPEVPIEDAIGKEPSSNEKAPIEKKAGDDDTAGAEFQPISPRTKVTFNLEEADLPELVRLISNMTGRRFILPGKIRSIKATVFAPTKVTAAEAYRAFLSILEVNGLTVVPTGRYLKITETGGVESQPLQIYGDGTGVPAVDRYITRLHYLENVSADDVTTLLSRFKSKEGNISAYAPTNMLIITDTGTQIRRMMKLIRAVDVPRTGTQTWIEPIHYANASEMAARLQEIFPIGDAPRASSTTRPRPRPAGAKAAEPAAAVGQSAAAGIRNIIADERTNSLIIIATERAYLKILEMIRQLDIPLEGEGRIHVHYVQNSAATDIAAALSALIGGSGAGRTAAQQRRTAGRQTTPTPAVASGTLFEGEIRVTAYEPSNALVITSSFHDYAALKRVIERLDAPRRQVFIEAVILELGLSRTTDLGISYHAGAGDFPTDGSLSVFGFDAGSTIGGLAGAATDPSSNFLTGLALGVQGPTIENSQQLVGFSVPGFGVAVTALAQSGDVNILSTPHIMAMDNVEAEISVGENIPLQTSGVPAGALTSFTGLASAAGQAPGGASLTGAGGVPRQDVGTTIRITPHINEANEMRLEIEEEISEKGATEGTLGVVSISRRTARTELMVRDQQTIVIGGLMREATSTSETKVPVLGDIPILGALFRKQSDDTRKTNLLLVLTPYIIRDPSDLRSIFERKMRERQEFIDRFFVLGDDDYEPVVDYSRTRGLVTEIINEITVVEQEMALAQAAMEKPALNHIPRTPIGSYEASVSESVVIVPEGQTITEPPPSRSPNVPLSEPGTPPSRP